MHDGSHAWRASKQASFVAQLIERADVARGKRTSRVVGGGGGLSAVGCVCRDASGDGVTVGIDAHDGSGLTWQERA